MVDSSLGNGCVIQSGFTDGSVVRIGINANSGAGYITAFNENWGDIEEDATYPVIFDVDGSMYEGQARGIWLNDISGAEVMAINLTGTMAGLENGLVCQDAQNQSGNQIRYRNT